MSLLQSVDSIIVTSCLRNNYNATFLLHLLALLPFIHVYKLKKKKIAIKLMQYNMQYMYNRNQFFCLKFACVYFFYKIYNNYFSKVK